MNKRITIRARKNWLLFASLFLMLLLEGCWNPDEVKLQNSDGGDGDADGDADGDSDGDSDSDGPPSITSISATPECAGVGTALVFSTDASGEITGYSWDFGDSVVSTEESPSHFYANPGFYDITLTVTGPDGEDSLSEEEMIRVIEPGWTKLHPPSPVGRIREIWQDSDSDADAVAVGDKGFMRWGGSSWSIIDVPMIDQFNYVTSHESWSGSSALILGEDENNYPVVVFNESGDVENADPTGLLPDEEYTNYLFAVMDW